MFGAAGHLLYVWRIARTLARHDALFPLDLVRRSPPLRRGLRMMTLFAGKEDLAEGSTPGERLAAALQTLGPTFIKFGQALATRPDIIGPDISSALRSLQDSLSQFPADQARQIIEDDLMRPIDDLFPVFSERAVAAASIAQVHRATTPDGRDVAVKVVRPDIQKRFSKDLETFRWAAKWIERLAPISRRLRPRIVIETFAQSVVREMDLRNEAAAASEVAENMAGEAGYRVPEIDWDRTDVRVLTTEWIDGVPLGDREAVVAAGHDMSALAKVMVRSFLLQTMRDGLFHADMHQGNFFVAPDGDLVAVDFGIVGRLERDSRRYLAEIIKGFADGDYRRLAEIHFEAGYVPEDQDVIEFAQALRAIGEPVRGRQVQDIAFSRMLAQLFETTETFQMRTQPQLLLLQKSMVMVEGLALYLDPDVNMYEISPPLIREWMEANMGPQAFVRDGVDHLREVILRLPKMIDTVDALHKTLDKDGIKLHPDTLKAMSDGQQSSSLGMTLALWAIAALLAALLVVQL